MFGWFSDKMFSLAVNNEVISAKIHTTFHFVLNVGIATQILAGSLLNIRTVELYLKVCDSSVDFSISFKAGNVCLLIDCIYFTSSKFYLYLINFCFHFVNNSVNFIVPVLFRCSTRGAKICVVTILALIFARFS